MMAYKIGFVKHKSERRMSSKVLLFYAACFKKVMKPIIKPNVDKNTKWRIQ